LGHKDYAGDFVELGKSLIFHNIVQMQDGKALDKFGNITSPKTPEAHIPLTEFNYQVKS